MRRFKLLKIVVSLAIMALVLVIVGFSIPPLWNYLIPPLFGGPVITFGQAVGLFLLTRILFFPFHPWAWGRGYRGGPRGDYWRKRFEEKLNNMPPEERERFRQQYHGRCGGWRQERTETQTSSGETVAGV